MSETGFKIYALNIFLNKNRTIGETTSIFNGNAITKFLKTHKGYSFKELKKVLIKNGKSKLNVKFKKIEKVVIELNIIRKIELKFKDIKE